MVAIDTFLSVGKTSARLPGPERRHTSAGALIGAPVRVDSKASIGGSPGGRGSAQKRFQPLVKRDGNCSEMPVKTW